MDPGGEADRVAALGRAFGLTSLSKDEERLLADAREDASDAQAGGAATDMPIGHMTVRHPLGQHAEGAATLDEARADWDALLAGAEPVADAASWRRLWWRFMDAEPFHRIPHQPGLPDHSVAAHRSLAAALVRARAGGDEAALLLVQVGPVQPLIEASRRTYDLWAGSYLMSLLAFQAVKALVEKVGPEALLVPRPDALAIARATWLDEGGDPADRLQPALPAKVTAVVPAREARALGQACVAAMDKAWAEAGAKAKGAIGTACEGWDEGFEAQLRDLLQRGFTAQPWPRDAGATAAWLAALDRAPDNVPLGRPGATYGALSGALWDLHKAARTARLPAAHQGDERFKCTLCGERERMGPVKRAKNDLFWQGLREREDSQIKRGEALCAVCLTKRSARGFVLKAVGLDPEGALPLLQIPSIPTLASAPFRWWMHQALAGDAAALAEGVTPGQAKARIEAWVAAAGALSDHKALPTPPGNGLRGLGELGREGRPGAWTLLDLDGAWMDEDAYEPERAWHEQTAKSGEPPPDFCQLVEAAKGPWLGVQGALGGKPSHYVAALYLDGDRMSRWLTGTHGHTPTYGAVAVHPERLPDPLRDQRRPVFPALQSELSARLSRLAGGEVDQVVGHHLGRLVYCGGDDVVALLPLATALRCAWALEALFREPSHLGPAATVSAGIAVQHQREALSRLVRDARAAERAAKKERDRVVVRLLPRSGDPMEVALPWRDDAGSTLAALEALVDGDGPLDVLGKLPARLREELRQLRDGQGGWRAELVDSRLRGLVNEEARGPKPKDEDLNRLLALPRRVIDDPKTYRTRDTKQHPVVDLLLLARFLRRETRGLPLDALLSREERS